jgi:glycosyltransferase involved in cell wall biosynthesis
MPPEVTVVIAAYNAETFLGETLASVFAQSLANIEVIVVDDGSTDRTPEILGSAPDRRLKVIRRENGGVSAARNTGLAAALAPYVFFLDADDILLPNALERMVAVLERSPERVACFAHHIRIAPDGSELSDRSDLPWKLFPAGDTLRHLIAKNFIVCGAICIRTQAAQLVRGFNPDLKWGEDWEFWCRLAVLGDFAAMPGQVVLLYRQHFTSTNFKLRNSPLQPNFRAIEAVYSNPAIKNRFSPAELRRRRRLAHIDGFWTGARNACVHGRMLEFWCCLIIGAFRYPDSILRPRLVYLFVRALRQQIGRPTGRRDKAAAIQAQR